MLPLIVALLIPAACITLIIYLIFRRRKLNKQAPDPLQSRKYEQIQLWKGFIFQLAPVVGFIMILGYLTLKNEIVIDFKGITGFVYWAIAIALLALYRKVKFQFVKSEDNAIGYKLVALKETKIGKSNDSK